MFSVSVKLWGKELSVLLQIVLNDALGNAKTIKNAMFILVG